MAHDWKKVVVSPEFTMREVIELVDLEGLRIALVVDEGNHLLGVVTDGDVRRGLLRQVSLEDAVTEVMNPNPITVKKGTPRREIEKLMYDNELLHLPRVSERNELLGLESLYELKESKKYSNPVFLMAGGFGTRLRPLTDDCPKPMLKVGEQPILERIIRQFKENGFYRFYVSLHYLPEAITEYFGDGSALGVDIEYVFEETPLGTGGALSLLAESSDLPLILMNGDILTNCNFESLLRFHNEANVNATLCVREHEHQIPFGVVDHRNMRLLNITEKPIERYHINAGIYVLSPKVYKNVETDKYIDMPTLLQNDIESNEQVAIYPIHEYWLDIGRFTDYEKAQKDVKSLSPTD